MSHPTETPEFITMTDTVKILFLAANPMDTVSRLRLDEEIREIGDRIRQGAFGHRIEIVSEWAVRINDLQAALQRHLPDIVHFSGHGRRNKGLVLEDQNGNGVVVDKHAVVEMFKILKNYIRIVVLNACYARAQAMSMAEIIDFTIGMNTLIEDKAATVFASYFYQSLAFGRTVQDAFDLAVNQLKLEGVKGAKAPELLVREGADATRLRMISPTRGVEEPEAEAGEPASLDNGRRPALIAFLCWTLGALSIGLLTDVLRRFIGGGWSEVAAAILQPVFIGLAVLAAVLTGFSLLRPAYPLVAKAARVAGGNRSKTSKKPVAVMGVVVLMTFALKMSLPMLGRFYNERGIQHQYRKDPDLPRAREFYQRSARLDPGYAQAHYDLAAVEEDLEPEKPEIAINEYLLAINCDRRMFAAYNNLARLYLRRGNENDYENALTRLGTAWDLAPQDDDVQYSLRKNLGWANYALKHYSEAETYLRSAISLRKDNAAAHCLLAFVLMDRARTAGATGSSHDDKVTDECMDCVRYAAGPLEKIDPDWVQRCNEWLDERGK